MADDGGIQLDTSFGKFCKQYGWATFEAELTSVIEAVTALTINRNAALQAATPSYLSNNFWLKPLKQA